jgi:hypothetical protein
MWESHIDFQGRWEGWKTCFWFSRLSTDRHFHSFPLAGFGSFLLLLGRAAEAIRFGSGFQNMSPVRDAIEQRLAQPRVWYYLGPFRKWQVRGELQ